MLLRALFLRPLRRRPWRFAVTVVGVAAGVAALVATLAASAAALYSLREGVAEIAGRARLEITAPGGVDERLLGQLRPLAQDALLAPVIEELALCPRIDDALRLLGVDVLIDADVRDVLARTRAASAAAGAANGDAHDAATSVDAERLLAALRGQGAWLPAPLARELGLRVGDQLELELRSRPRSLEVLGVFECDERTPALARLVVVDVALAQELCGRIGRLDRIELVPRAGVSIAELQRAGASLLPDGVTIAEPQRRAAQTAAMVRSLEFNLSALSGISLFAAGVLVATTLATSVVQRRATLALLRSLGAAPESIARAILTEALVIGVLGSGAGILLGFFGARLLLVSMRSTVATVVGGAPESAIRFDVRHALLGAGLGVCVSLAAAVLPVLEALRTPPIQGLRRERPEFLGARARRIALALSAGCVLLAIELARLPAIDRLPVPALLAALCLMGGLLCVCSPAIDALGHIGRGARFVRRFAITLRLACAALAAGRRRAAWAAGAVGVAVALAISIATLVSSFRSTVIAWTDAGLRADLSIRPSSGRTGIPLGRLDPTIVLLAQQLFGAGVVDPFHTAPAYVGDMRITLGGADFEVARQRGGLAYRDGRDARLVLTEALRAHRVLVNEAFARRTNRSEGDTVTLDVRGGTLTRTIEAVFYDYGDSQGLVVLDRTDFLALYPDDGPREIALFLPPGADAQQARAAMLDELAGRFRVTILDRRELRANVLSVFERTFAITSMLQVVAIAVAVVAVLSVLFALVSERRGDLALLRALGSTRLQIGAQIALQSALLGALGAGLGTLTGVLIGLVLVKVVNLQSFGWTLDFVQPWSALWATAASVVAACLIAGCWPAVRAARAGIRDELREESEST